MSINNYNPHISLPPVLEDYDKFLKGYALNLEKLPLIKWKSKHWKRDVNLDNTLTYLCQPPANATLKPERDPFTGAITGWKEIVLNQKNPCTDLGMSRPPLPAHLATRGNAMQLPFWPAGFLEETQEKQAEISAAEQVLKTTSDHDDEPGYFLGEEMLVAPDGGYTFEEDGCTPIILKKEVIGEENYKEPLEQKQSHHIAFENIDVNDLVNTEDHLKDLWTDTEDNIIQSNQRVRKVTTVSESQSTVEDEILESSVMESINNVHETPVLNITQVVNKTKLSTEWAETLDVSQPVEDFDTLIPNMAHKYPFELDIFQKQAILKLEQQAHVFVAAHTSAGKTAVAEYAIALSQRHCTRTVYTSPIKALSNQKYHDFKKTFGDVGLMTGDLQINQTASCLVMTTEILRSMLYCGSDVTRDLEFVIFDEVHYINNTERGHVWEEVLILLPAHVGIVMLSATVPNTLEFADWVGRTKQRKVYVISTPRRPVPLCHYLYTGSGGKSKNERFMVLDQDGKFILKGYNDAVAAKESRLSEFKKTFGPKGARINPKQEATMWTAFIDHLRSNDQLPVIAFTLSRNKCDQNAEALMSMDLTTGKEKSRIHMFFQRCLQRLKQPDRQLPQVLRMQRVLEHGIGVHHSGILPMLKEIVEMLFQAGLVKILFATETFAMGVNMPARTVVFNEVRKYDGLEWRPLAPAEFIQMAGRAGRRGLDPTGTVVILCKECVPELGQLREMMLGTPTKLSSQFRLTYSMILSLLRVATVSVEGMMQRSFREFDQQTQASAHRKQLAALEQQYQHSCSQPLPAHLQPLIIFYEKAAEYIELRSDLMPVILEQPKVSRDLAPGRVLLVSVGPHINQLALLLNCKGPRATPFKVLVLDAANEDKSDTDGVEKTDNWYTMLSLSHEYGSTGTDTPTLRHTILHAAHKNILQISKITWKYDVELIIRDWEKRQMARFRDAPVGATCLQAVQELAQLSHAVRTGALRLDYVPLMQNLPITSGELLDSLSRMANLKTELESLKKSTDIANFEKEFGLVYERMEMERKRDKLRRLLSYESMVLYPDYQRRLQVLRELRYIDSQHRVALKGRVACEMGTNELIITELVFRNTLTDLAPAEIAALLSCLVFQARTQAQHDLTPKLDAGVKAITVVDEDLRSLENKYRVGQDDHVAAGDRLNFGLVKVVYEWARDKPFSEIMDLTDVQEGIIVRCIQQLHEVLMDVRDAAKIIGDPSLQAKMLEASAAIKRDIVFAASLYTTTTQKDNVTI